jgi:hypothetical protein
LIEDNSGDASLIREVLAEVKGATFDPECVESLSTELERRGNLISAGEIIEKRRDYNEREK